MFVSRMWTGDMRRMFHIDRSHAIIRNVQKIESDYLLRLLLVCVCVCGVYVLKYIVFVAIYRFFCSFVLEVSEHDWLCLIYSKY